MKVNTRLLVLLLCGTIFLLSSPARADWQQGFAAYERGDYSTALHEFRKGANHGDAGSMNVLGVMYAKGQGVQQDDAEAVKWYGMAAELGEPYAQSNLAFAYLKGLGVRQEYGQAAQWYRKAAEQGHSPSQNNLGWMYENGLGVQQDYANAVKWYRISAGQDNSDAKGNLKRIFYRPPPAAGMIRWLHMAANEGDAEAQYALGRWHGMGEGLSEDHARACFWFHKAAELGNANGLRALPGCYYKKGIDGRGVWNDTVLAYALYDLIVRTGLAEGSYEKIMKESLREDLTSAQRTEGEKLLRGWKVGMPLPQKSKTWAAPVTPPK